VVVVGLVDEQKPARGLGQPSGPVRAVLDDPRVAVPVGVVDEEAVVALVVQMKATESRPCSPPDLTRLRISRNGCARSLPFTSTRITPGCSTTYSFPGSLLGAVT